MPNRTPEALALDDTKARANLDAAARQASAAPPVVVFRATFATGSQQCCDALADIVADIASTVGIADGAVSLGYGFGAWGVEPCATVESATPHVAEFHTLVRALLRTFGQACAYVTVNGRAPYELDAAGFVTAITGTA